ncbi:MAG: hypothetical protein NTZ87_01400 [Candidatus Nomurabacteria bacterium]|nr:hypothetical protein [Candidatus Nomurabacteria bacterium]
MKFQNSEKNMKTVLVCDRQVQMPSPVYIIPETMQISEETNTISGKCLFPSSDPSVGDRKDHANVCHEMFTVWNCAYVWAERKGWGRLFVIESHQSIRRMTPPDTEIDFVVKLKKATKRGNRVIGSAEAKFSLKGMTLSLIVVDKFANKKV